MAAGAVKPFRFAEAGSSVLRKWNEERKLARSLSLRARRDFAGAGINRLTLSMAQSSRSINADLDSSLVILRSRARSLCANYDYARRFLSLVANNIVGPDGPTLQVRATMSNGKDLDKVANDAIEWHWGRWGETCDIRGLQTLPQMLQVAVKGSARDGESLVRMVREKSLPYGTALQLLEADRLDEALNQRLSNGNVIRMGVELDGALRPVAYWVLTQHPGENYNVATERKHARILAGDLHNLYVSERPEQVRGYTWMHAVLLRAAHSQGYEEAAVVAARLGASKVGFFKRTGDAAADGIKQLADAVDTTTHALQMNAEPGEFMDLPPGYDFTSFDPDYPHQMYGDFVRSCLRGFASGVDIDYASLSNDRSSENYSSIRHGALEARDVWKTGQEWLASRLLRPVYRDWLATALILGKITLLESGKVLPADKYSKFAEAAKFRGRRWDWVDPLKDAQAAKELISAGLTSRTRIAAAQGEDFEDIVDELAQEQALLDEAGIVTDLQVSSQPADPSADGAAPAGGKSADGSERMLRLALARALVRKPEPSVTNVTVPVTNNVTVPERQLTLEAHIAAPNVEVKAGDVHVDATLKVDEPLDMNIRSMPERESVSATERNQSGQISGVRQTEKDA